MLRISPNIRNTHNLDGGVILDVRHGRMFALNFVGSRIVELLKCNYQDMEIANEISQEFGVDPDLAAADVREFIESLESQDLIERRDADVTSF
ncbi:MAG: PqqD family protein [Acidobacteria bacterium]|nr:PqqD family protein [Acidobacteriota bacterium]